MSGSERFRDAGHLPGRRSDGLPADPYDLPRQRRGVTPQMHGRYPDFDVLAEADHWDPVTRKVVLARVGEPPPIRFFDQHEAATLSAFCDTVTAQDAEPRIPLVAIIDDKLAAGRLDGFQYAGMPDDRDTWRMAARGLDEAAGQRGAASFAELEPDLRHEVCEAFAGGRLSGGTWDELDVTLAWGVVMRGTLQAFYSHPWAWNEIGFAGPAYPRGFARLGAGLSEAWEGSEAFDLDPVKDAERRGLE